eukprot:Skav221343  [mRNA]  locus=scaffold1845:93359:93610:+ [translate_table: standard]
MNTQETRAANPQAEQEEVALRDAVRAGRPQAHVAKDLRNNRAGATPVVFPRRSALLRAFRAAHAMKFRRLRDSNRQQGQDSVC